MAKYGESVRCENGHHYYPELNPICPQCVKEGKINKSTTTEKPMMRPRRGFDVCDEDDTEVTVSAASLKRGFNPIAGWLVCIEGKFVGKDYRIHGENNFIGRDRSMDICIPDETVSRQRHATISFDDRTGTYYYIPGMERNIDRINEAAVFSPTELKEGDVIEIGNQKLLFVPLCGKKFKWEDWDDNEETK